MAVVTESGLVAATDADSAAVAHMREILGTARAGIEEAFAALERVACPESAALEARVTLGNDYVKKHPTEVKAFRLLAQLRREHKAALADPIDAARREAWSAAMGRYQGAETLYLARVREARERFGLEESEL